MVLTSIPTVYENGAKLGAKVDLGLTNYTADTTDTTVTSIWSFALPQDSALGIKAFILGKNVAGSVVGFYNIVAAAKNESGTAAIVGTSVIDSVETDAGLAATVTVSTDTVSINVVGLAATAITWVAQVNTTLIEEE